MTPAVVNGYAPSNIVWKLVMSSWLSIAILLIAFRAAVIELPCPSKYWIPVAGLVRAVRS
jgi:hypothetical protein